MFRSVAVIVVPLNETVTLPVVKALSSVRTLEVIVVPKSTMVIASFPKPVIVPEE